MKIEVTKVLYIDTLNVVYISFKACYFNGNLITGQLKVSNIKSEPSEQTCKGIILNHLNTDVPLGLL